jgi:alkylation response protein AidB-like acyl-CoA dehydrogenase
MDLELSDEQRWLGESVETLLAREWPAPESVAAASPEQRRRVWSELVGFGALAIGGEDGIGALEACLIARALGAHLASAPYISSAAARLAVGDSAVLSGEPAVALALLEPGSDWSLSDPATLVARGGGGADGRRLSGEKVAVEHAEAVDLLAVVARWGDVPALVLVPAAAQGVVVETRSSFDATLPMSAVVFDGAGVDEGALVTDASVLPRLQTAGALLAAAEALGAADAMLYAARRYAGERRQFGRRIGSFQALRHILADLYVRTASGWSAVLYAAAAFDEGAEDTGQNASIAKAYVSRAAREVAHGSMQVFGGIAFTDEHPAHRFLRRIVVREQQFGDAAHHERALGRELARRAREHLLQTVPA